MTANSVLVVDVGTSGLRAAIVDDSGTVCDIEYVAHVPSTPAPGLVEFDAEAMYRAVVKAMNAVLVRNPRDAISSVGITNQRASTIAWDARNGQPLAAGIGWQDLRTVGECITAPTEHGVALAPNQTATKAAWLIANARGDVPFEHLRIGTIDAWLTWKLTAGTAFVTDHTNAAVTGLVDVSTVDWSPALCDSLRVPIECLPTVVPSRSVVGSITGHDGLDGLVLAARIGDQQASLVGQGCIEPGRAKITFGTGGMLDMYTGHVGPTEARRSPTGTFPIVTYSVATDHGSPDVHWGSEAVMLSAGTNVEWLCDDMGLIATPADSDSIAASVDSTDGVSFVPALLGLGTPDWDYGARGALLGLTRGTTRAHIVRAVLDGIAHRGADLLDATIAETRDHDVPVPESLRIDGGMSRNATFIGLLADATGLAVEVSPVTESTTLGAAFLAGSASGVWANIGDACATWRPARVVEPATTSTQRADARAAWRSSVAAARGWIPALSALDF